MRVEKKYEILKNGKLDEEIQDEWAYSRIKEIDKKISLGLMTIEEVEEREELNKKIDGKDKEYLKNLDGKKLKKIKDNMQKVENIFEIKNQIKEQIKQVKREIINKYDSSNYKNTNSEYANKTNEELAKINFELGIKSSMCNEAIRGLLDGKNINNIKLDKNTKDKEFNSDEEIYNVIRFENEIKNDIEEENALLEISKFEQKYPVLSKIINWFKTKFWKKTTKNKEQPTLEETLNNRYSFINIPKGIEEFGKLLRIAAEKEVKNENQ